MRTAAIIRFGGAALLAALLSGCQRNIRPPDVTGFVTLVDTLSKPRSVQVEVDPTDSITSGRGSMKALIHFLPSARLPTIKLGCVVSVWYAEGFPLLDSYPLQAQGQAAEVVRCP